MCIRDRIITATLKTLEVLTQSDFELVKSCFRLIARLLRLNLSTQLKAEQIKILIDFITQNMTLSESVTEPLECLSALVERKEVRLEIYELIDRMTEMMITTFNQRIQSLTRRIFVRFLLTFPLTDKLLSKHVYFLLKNIRYRDIEGRRVIIECLRDIVETFPEQLLAPFGEIIMYQGIVARVNEDDEDLRHLLSQIMTLLLRKISEATSTAIIQQAVNWINEPEKPSVSEGGFIFFSIATRAGIISRPVLNNISSSIKRILEATATTIVNVELKNAKDDRLQTSKVSAWATFLEEELSARTGSGIHMEDDLSQAQIKLVSSLLGFLSVLVDFQGPAIFYHMEILRPTSDILLTRVEALVTSTIQLFKQLTAKNAKEFMANVVAGPDLLYRMRLNLLRCLSFEALQSDILELFIVLVENDLKHKDADSLLKLAKMLSISVRSSLKNAKKEINLMKRKILIFSELSKRLDWNDQTLEDAQIYDYLMNTLVRIEVAKDLLEKFTEDVNIENAKVIEQIRERMDSNRFLLIYNRVKTRLIARKQQAKEARKSKLLLAPEEAIEEKRKKYLRKRLNMKNRLKFYKLTGSFPRKRVKLE
eukprot:TRINITY_DN11862_c0_g1_i1.p1 TRINITY_DN11862_c0_g1~~TRINITY_DN11862_c0_g1_i1.p1  ORF type:complete len:614 (+),score=147.33 TRINITY_DN11862_c0_g1_i1:61-1842(+)